MAGVKHGVIVDATQTSCEALVHLLWVRPGQISSPAAVEKQRVAGNQSSINEETLTARRMTRCMDEFDLHGTDRNHVSRLMGDERCVFYPGDLLDILSFISLNMDRHINSVKQCSDALEVESHH